MILVKHKAEGETMGQFIERIRLEELAKNPGSTIRYSYIGRLDPLASGIVPICEGEAVEERRVVMEYPKRYEVSVLCGVGTDTGDPLGMISLQSEYAWQDMTAHAIHKLSQEKIKKELSSLLGVHNQPYPQYSSKPYRGKPLWMWGRDGADLDQTAPDYPRIMITLFEIDLLKVETVPLKVLCDQFALRLAKVTTDYRQDDVMGRWREYVDTHEDLELPVITISVLCSSGTYMRWLAPKLAKVLGFADGLAWKIVRTAVGPYKG
jgi:tRNA pseudouridine(55) synthase